jgi:hypothetical protein
MAGCGKEIFGVTQLLQTSSLLQLLLEEQRNMLTPKTSSGLSLTRQRTIRLRASENDPYQCQPYLIILA